MPDPVRRLSIPPLAGLEGQRCGALGSEGLRYGYRIPFLCDPPLSKVPISLPSYHPLSTKGVALGEVTQALIAKSAVELVPLPSLSFYSRLFVVWKTSGSWRPIIDLSTLNLFVDVSHGDHPVCPSFCSSGRLDGLHRPQGSLPAGPCPSGLSSLPSVCVTGQCVPVLCPLLWPIHSSTGLLTGHGSCFCHSSFLRYPHAAVPQRLARPVVLSRISPSRPSGGPRSLPRAGDCCEPGEIPPRTFSGSPVSRGGDRLPIFQGFSITEWRHQATVNSWRISVLSRSSSQYLALASRHALLPLPSCSGRTTSCEISPALSPQVLGSRGSIDPWSPDFLRDLRWWLDLPRLSLAVSLAQVSPDLDFWSDASDVGWGAHLGSLTASDLWDLDQGSLSINARELLAIREGLLHFQSSLAGKNVSVFCDKSTAVSYLRKEGGTRSPFLNTLTQGILRWAESLSIRLLRQLIPGSLNVLADSLSLALTSSLIPSCPFTRRFFGLSVACGWSK